MFAVNQWSAIFTWFFWSKYNISWQYFPCIFVPKSTECYRDVNLILCLHAFLVSNIIVDSERVDVCDDWSPNLTYFGSSLCLCRFAFELTLFQHNVYSCVVAGRPTGIYRNEEWRGFLRLSVYQTMSTYHYIRDWQHSINATNQFTLIQKERFTKRWGEAIRCTERKHHPTTKKEKEKKSVKQFGCRAVFWVE